MRKLKLKVHDHSIKLPDDIQVTEGEEVVILLKEAMDDLEQAKLYEDFREEDSNLAEEGMEDYSNLLKAEDEER